MQDSLKINQNKDGTFSVEWDKKDPKWNFLNKFQQCFQQLNKES